MVLTDVDGSTVWNANTISTNVDRAELLNSGNLVLKDPNGRILWQSFDSPTNTLLPSQTLTKGKRLVSARRKGEVSSGYFILFFDSENVLRLMYDGPDISRLYWPNPDFDAWGNGRSTFNSSRSAVLDNMGEFSSSDRLKLYASDLGVGIRRRLTLDYDGNLRLYSLNESTGLWLISWVALPQQCNIHGLCGRYGVCIYTPMPKCTCLQGYEMNDLGDWSKGCKPKFSKNCNTQMVKFVELPRTDFFGFDLNYSEGISLESCKKICLDDCSCEAFQYRLEGNGRCWAKSALFNGRNSPNLHGTIYLKLPKSLATENSSQFKGLELVCGLNESEVFVGSSDVYKESTGTEYRHFLWFALSVGGIEILFIAAGWWFLFKEHGMQTLVEEGYRRISNQFKRFTYAELKKATDQFKDELGRGGSGSVYKGVLADKRAVAVKKLRDVFQCEEEFWAEVSTIGRINHMNLVRMWGYCSEKAHRLLVSEYVENGSLDKYLFSDGSSKEPARLLGWNERFKIAVGTAKGLAYLHHQCLEWVIHCDVKPENILLGCDFEPKIADFGLAKLSQRGGPGSNFSRVRGTKGYMAPEWTLNLPITAKVDVYSYGIVLLEIVKGSRLGDDDDYFGDFEDGDEGDEGGLFRRRLVLQELFDRKFVDAVLQEWYKTMMDLPAGLRQAYEMGLVSSAQMVRFLAINARPTTERLISRALPQPLSRAFIGRMLADPSFLYKLLLEQAATVGCSIWWEFKNRKERIKQEWDLALINVLTVSACNAVIVWSLAPCRSYGNTFQFDLQNTLQKLPNNIFEKSYPLREFDLQKRIHSFFYKAAELCMIGLTAGAAQGALSKISASKKEGRVSVTIPTVSTNALGYGAFLGLYANLRYQLLCGIDRAIFNHFDVLGVVLFFSTALRVLNIQIGETSRLAWLGVEADPLVQSNLLSKAYNRQSEAVDKSSSNWFISKNTIVSGLGLLGIKQGAADPAASPKARKKRVIRKKVTASSA